MKDGINRVLCRLPREGKLSKEKFEFWGMVCIIHRPHLIGTNTRGPT